MFRRIIMALNQLAALGNQAQPQPQQQQGGLGQWLKELLMGTPGGFDQLQNFDPDQLAALQQLLQGGLEQVQNPYGGFEPIQQEATRQFQQETVPGLAERFSSMGAGAQRSSAFGQQLGAAGAGLSSQLAALRSQYGMQNRAQGLQQAGIGLTPRFQYAQRQGSQGLLGGLLPAAAKLGTNYLSGGMSSLIGL